jgi:glycine cleavage system H protein
MGSAIPNKMNGFNYNNIFETKGIEYLVVIAFLALLIPFWIILNKRAKITGQKGKRPGILTALKLKIPQGIYYSRNHTWTYLEMSGNARIGIDDLLFHLTGEVNFTHLKNPGEKIKKGDLMAEIEHKGKTLRTFSPLSGEVLSTNSMLTDNPELLSEDPYVNGWLYKVKPALWTTETNSYYMAEDATNWLGKELERFKDFLSGSQGRLSPDSARLVLQDGGELTDHTLSDLPGEVWQNFQRDFLNHTDAH